MVNWSTFETLPGSVTYNFEMLCRALVWLNYSRFGSFKAMLNQPGIEFELKLHTDSPLGVNGCHFGWQCKWYDLAKGKPIGKTRRDQIQDALKKSIDANSNLTDWVLWTRHPLTKSDQTWFYGLNTNLKLHLWNSHEAETLLNLNGEQLKRTYFGDLIVTPEQLHVQHEQSVASIRKRWYPQVHQKVDAERSVRRMLGNSSAWDEVMALYETLKEHHDDIQLRIATIPENLLVLAEQFQSCILSFAAQLKGVYEMLSNGNFSHLNKLLTDELVDQLRQISSFPRKARGARLQIGLIATDAKADLDDAAAMLLEVTDFLSTRLVGVVADAGGGKTQLAAELTASEENRPAGILLLGRFLNHNSSLDTLAAKIVINGTPVPSMQALLAALNAAAERAKCILPIVIDGLNEAEDPRDWHAQLSSLQTTLKMYPSVLVICTLRSGAQKRKNMRDDYYYDSDDSKPQPFVKDCLPEGTITFEIPDFGDDVGDAMKNYFKYFKIEAQPGLAYEEFLSHPLTLRIFCQVTNPDREKYVGMEAVPRSLAALFERYTDQAALRIEELAPFHCRFLQADIINYLDVLGRLLWNRNARTIDQRSFRTEIGDERNVWNNSAVNFMEQEGLLLRMPGKVSGDYDLVPTYDLLGGYLIARYIISKNGRDTIGPWLEEEKVVSALSVDYSSQHPLRDDVIRFLVALLPQSQRIHLWQVANSSLRGEALVMAVLLEQKYLDKATVDAIEEAIKNSPTHQNLYFGNLYDIHNTEKHPLNALFVDRVLSGMITGKRDLIWSEWLRRNEKLFQRDIDDAISSWSTDSYIRATGDYLFAHWLMWMLTSSSHKLRHQVTLALYWYGRGDSERLFQLTIRSISIDDPYVPERMLAASYGVAMAQISKTEANQFCTEQLPAFSRNLYDHFFKSDAPNPTTHILILDYVRGIVELAQVYNPGTFSEDELNATKNIHPGAPKPKDAKAMAEKVCTRESPFRMDFENYVLGNLTKGRHNYDFKHKGFQKIKSEVLWRVLDLGWSIEDFSETDKKIEASRDGYDRHDGNKINKVDRYGKKYSWIAYFEQLGRLGKSTDEYDDIYLDRREADADIDPSFPQPIYDKRIINLDVLGNSAIALREWVKSGEIPDLGVYLQLDQVEGQSGPWVLLDGHIGQQDEHRGRSMFGFFRAFFVSRENEAELVARLEKQRLGGRWLPENEECRGAFAGEIPWSSHFRANGRRTLSFVVSEKTIQVEEDQDWFYIDGIGLELSFLDKLKLAGISFPISKKEVEDALSDKDFEKLEVRKEPVMVDKVVQEHREIPVLQPVCNLHTPGKTLFESFTGGTTLVKELIDKLGLKAIPQTRDLQNETGDQVTFQNSYRKKSFKNSERLFYLKKDLLDSLLENMGMSLVWVVWGERELSLGRVEVWDHNNGDGEKPYADFKQIHVYSPECEIENTKTDQNET